jgi:hypothetical protein
LISGGMTVWDIVRRRVGVEKHKYLVSNNNKNGKNNGTLCPAGLFGLKVEFVSFFK